MSTIAHMYLRKARSPFLTQQHLDILDLFDRFGDLSHYGVIHASKAAQVYRSPSGLRTRVSELVNLGLVKDSLKREATPSGRQATIWTLA